MSIKQFVMARIRMRSAAVICIIVVLFLLIEFFLGIFLIAEDDVSEFRSIIYQMENDVHYPFMEFDPVLFWKLKANIMSSESSVAVNSWHMRDSEFEHPEAVAYYQQRPGARACQPEAP